MNGDYFVGIILPFAGLKVPDGWYPCDGRVLSSKVYGALYSIIGTQFGGDPTNFKLPNLQGSIPVGVGQGTNLSQVTMGQVGGTDQVYLTNNQLPNHSHTLVVSGSAATVNSPANNFLGNPNDPSTSPSGVVNAYSNASPNVTMNSQMISTTGSGMPHNNIMPSLTIQYIICCVGSFPNPS